MQDNEPKWQEALDMTLRHQVSLAKHLRELESGWMLATKDGEDPEVTQQRQIESTKSVLAQLANRIVELKAKLGAD